MENEPVAYTAQHHYHSTITIKQQRQENAKLLNLVGIMAIATLLLTIAGIVVSFK